ncbi:MAG TPA: hypothetical protein VIM89_03450 [Mucilaginibacter sp.]
MLKAKTVNFQNGVQHDALQRDVQNDDLRGALTPLQHAHLLLRGDRALHVHDEQQPLHFLQCDVCGLRCGALQPPCDALQLLRDVNVS